MATQEEIDKMKLKEEFLSGSVIWIVVRHKGDRKKRAYRKQWLEENPDK